LARLQDKIITMIHELSMVKCCRLDRLQRILGANTLRVKIYHFVKTMILLLF